MHENWNLTMLDFVKVNLHFHFCCNCFSLVFFWSENCELTHYEITKSKKCSISTEHPVQFHLNLPVNYTHTFY